VRRRTLSGKAIVYSPIMRLMESDMYTFGNKIFGAIVRRQMVWDIFDILGRRLWFI
jgi:hypothetical protein